MRPLLAVLALIPISGSVSAQAPLAPRLGDHLEATSALAREHQYHASVAGRVLRHDGAPAVGAQVLVYAYRPFYWALPLATARTDDDGAYRCDDVTGRGRSLLWVVAPDDTPFRTAWASLTLVSGEHTELRPVTLPEPTGEALPATTFRGRLLAADGRPLPGALLRLTHARDAFDPSCFAVTGRDGSFAIPVRTGTPEQAQLFFGRNRLEIELEPGTSFVEISAYQDNTAARVGPTSTYVGIASGCAGSRRATRLIPRDTPRIDRTLPITLFDLPVDVAMLAMSFQQYAAPVSLASLGMPGCDWHVPLDAVVLLSGQNHQARFELAIPDVPALVGTQFFHQALVLDPAAGNGFGAVVSDVARGIVGEP